MRVYNCSAAGGSLRNTTRRGHNLNCPTCGKEVLNTDCIGRLTGTVEHELVEVAKRMLRTATDPFSAVMHFLHERPENTTLPGYLMKKVLLESFGSAERIPSLIAILAGHVKEVARQSNVINIVNEHPAVERWGSYIIKQKERIKFELGAERGKMVLKNIVGLVAVDCGIEAPLERILVDPPKLEITLRLGVLRPQRVVDIV